MWKYRSGHPEISRIGFVVREFLRELNNRLCDTEVIACSKVQVLVVPRGILSVGTELAEEVASHCGELAVVKPSGVVVNIVFAVGIPAAGSLCDFGERQPSKKPRSA